MNCIFHIGLHKTGSTSIQSLFEENRALLGDDTRCLTRSSPEQKILRKLCMSFSQDPTKNTGQAIADEVKKLLKNMEHPDVSRVILTGGGISGAIPLPEAPESFYHNTVKVLDWVSKGCDGHQPSFVVYTRPVDPWLSSLYRHHLRTRGLKMTYPTFKCLPATTDLDFNATIENIRSEGHLLTNFKMENDFGTRLGVGTQLLQHLGYDDEHLKNWKIPEVKNQGIGERMTAFLSHPATFALPRKVRKFIASKSQKS